MNNILKFKAFYLIISFLRCGLSQCPELHYSYNNQCLAICPEGYQSNNLTSTCNKSFSCSITYIQSSSLGQSKDIQAVVSGTDSQVFTIYQTFLNALDITTGTFQRSFIFQAGTQFLNSIGDRIFLFNSSTNQIFEWIELTASTKFLAQVADGKLGVNFKIVMLEDNQTLVALSINESGTQLFLTKIYPVEQINKTQEQKLLSFNSIKAEVEISVIVKSNNVMLWGGHQIKFLSMIQFNFDSQNIIYASIINFSCPSLLVGTILELKRLQSSKSKNILFFGIFDFNKYVFILRNDKVCIPISLSQQPNGLQIIQKQDQYLLMVNSNNQISIFTIDQINDNLILSKNIEFSQIIIDSAYVLNSLIQSISIFSLSSISSGWQVISTTLQFSDSINQISQTTTKVLISSPKKLVALRASQIFVIGSDAQIIDPTSSKTTSVIQDFKNKIFSNEGYVTAMIQAEKQGFIVSCSSEGKIVVWKSIYRLDPTFLYSFIRTGDYCFDIQLFQDDKVVALLGSGIVGFNLRNYFEQWYYPASLLQFRKVLISQEYIYIFANNSLLLLYDLDKVYTKLDVSQLPLNKIQSVFITQSNHIAIIDTFFLISLYQVTLDNNLFPFISPMPKAKHQAPSTLILIKLFDQSKEKFSVVYYDGATSYVRILDSTLSLIQQIYIPEATVYALYQFEDLYLFSMKYSNPLIATQYSSITFNITSQESFKIGGGLVKNQQIQIKRKFNYYGEETIQYVGMSPLSFTSITVEGSWNKNLQTDEYTPFDRFTYAPGQYALVASNDSKDDYILMGTYQGQVRVSSMKKQVVELVKKKLDQKEDSYLSIQHNFILGRYCLIGFKVRCYSIHTDELLEEISFTSQVKQVYISDSIKILIAQTSTQLALQDFDTGKLYRMDTSCENSICPLSIINGFYLDEKATDLNRRLFIFGNKLISTNIELTNINNLLEQQSQFSSSQIQLCLFQPKILICRLDLVKAAIFDRTQNNLLINSFTLPSVLSGFTIVVDNLYEAIFFYTTVIQVFTYQGIFSTSITLSGYQIILFDFLDKNIAILTYSTAFFFLRSSLILRASFNGSIGGFLGGSYIADYSLFAYYLDEVRYGQVLFYNLETYSTQGSVTSAITPNGIGAVVKAFYDKDCAMLNFMDKYGNTQNLIISNQRIVDNAFRIEEIKEGYTMSPSDFLIDFNTNTLYIINEERLWRLNWNMFTRPFMRVLQGYHHNFIVQNEGDSNPVKVLICDKSNILYQYSEMKVIYTSKFDENILDMRHINLNNQQIYIIAFQDYLLVYISIPSSGVFDSSNFSNKIKSIRLKRYLVVEQSAVIFYTMDNIIADYDFANNQYNFSYLLDKKCEITEHILTGSISSNNLALIFVTDCGSIFKYIISTKIMYIYILLFQQNYFQYLNRLSNTEFSSYAINLVKNIDEQRMILVTDINGGVFSLDSSSLKQLSQQQLNNKVNWLRSQQQPTPSSIAQESRQTSPTTLAVQVLEIDLDKDILMINLETEKKLAIFTFSTMNFLQYLSFPDNEWKSIYWNSQYLLLTSTAQVNIHRARDLSFVGYIRRYNRKDRLTKVILIDGNKIILVFDSRIETILIDQDTTVALIDSLTVADATIILHDVNSEGTLRYIGISTNSIFERRLSLSLFNQLIENPSQKPVCYYSINYQTQAQIQNIFDYIINSSLNVSYLFNIKIQQQLTQIMLSNSQSSKIILRPNDVNHISLEILQDIFSNLPFNIFMEGFDWILLFQDSKISIFPQATEATFQNIFIQNQIINSTAGFYFQSKNLILFNNITFSNLTFTGSSNVSRYLSINSNSKRQLTTPIIESYSFLEVVNCQVIIISEIIIQDCNFGVNNIFMSANQFTNITIKSLTIKNSTFNQLFNLLEGSNVFVSSLQVVNCTCYSHQYISNYLLIIIGVENIVIDQLNAYDNKKIRLLKITKQYFKQNKIELLTSDILTLQQSKLFKNTLDDIFSNSVQYSLIELQSSYISINDIEHSHNQLNIYILNGSETEILNSIFVNNTGVLGAALSGSLITNKFNLINCQFLHNLALASGGALYLSDLGELDIDIDSIIMNNQAIIGGGIRIMNSQNELFWKKYSINCFNYTKQEIFNQAEIYGNDIGIYPTQFIIYGPIYSLTGEQQDENLQIIYKGTIGEINTQPLQIKNLQSGGIIPISVGLFDQKGEKFKMNNTKYQGDEYSPLIIKELSDYFVEVESRSSSTQNHLEIKGEALISIKQFSSDNNNFCFTSLILSSQPNAQVYSLIFKITLNSWYFPTSMSSIITFRNCILGEILVSSSLQIIQCQKCTSGTYTLKTASDSSCQKCPNSAQSCESSEIILNKGYWRLNNQTDEILQCNSQILDKCWESNADSKQGCLEGYRGPLCEKCDTIGQIWNNNRYRQSLSKYECSQCSSQAYQVLFAVLAVLAIFLYLFFSIFFFMGRYIYNSRCCYIRMLSILPISKSYILDESSFFIKSLLNYLQLSAILFTFQLQFLPQVIALFPQITGQPVSKIVVSLTCLYSIQDIENFGEERITLILQSVFPFTIFITFFIIIFMFKKYKIWEVTSYHKYTMINVVFLFFQSDSVSFFASALSCRSIGSQSYRTINLLLSCQDESYNRFAYSFVLPNLLFWILTPAFIFLQLIKNKRTKNLWYCTMKYKFGYFYLEFKDKYFYWEFIRIYIKICIVVMITLLQTLGMILYLISIIMIFFYIFLVMAFKPFESKLLYQQEILSYLILIPSIFISQLYLIYPHEILNLFIALIHFGYIFYIAFIILKFKLNSQNQVLTQKIIAILKYLMPESLFRKVIHHKIKTIKPLMRWKLIYRNLQGIRQKKIIEQFHILSESPKSLIKNKLFQSSKWQLAKDGGQMDSNINIHCLAPSYVASNSQLKDHLCFSNKVQSPNNNQREASLMIPKTSSYSPTIQYQKIRNVKQELSQSSTSQGEIQLEGSENQNFHYIISDLLLSINQESDQNKFPIEVENSIKTLIPQFKQNRSINNFHIQNTKIPTSSGAFNTNSEQADLKVHKDMVKDKKRKI